MATSSEIQSRCDQAQLGVLDVIHDGIHDVGVPPEGRLAPSGVGLRVNCEVRVAQLLKCVKKPLALFARAGGVHSMILGRRKSCEEISHFNFASDVLLSSYFISDKCHLCIPCGGGLTV